MENPLKQAIVYYYKMKTARRIAFNFVSLSLSEIVAKALQLFIFVYIARSYGKSDFGNFGFAIAFSAIFAVLTDFGMSSLLIREVSRDKKKLKKYFSNAILMKVFLGMLTFFLAFAYLNLMNYSSETSLIAYVLL